MFTPRALALMMSCERNLSGLFAGNRNHRRFSTGDVFDLQAEHKCSAHETSVNRNRTFHRLIQLSFQISLDIGPFVVENAEANRVAFAAIGHNAFVANNAFFARAQT